MLKELSLTGKVAIITGSTKGIGRGIAEGMALSGANVVVVSRNQQECDAVAAELQKHAVQAIGIKTDVTNMQEVEELVRKTVDTFGRIDILVNNAGSAITKKAENLTEEDWDRVINIDLKAVFFCAQLVGRQMIQQKSGKIINLASILGLVGEKQVLPYCVAKGGVIQMTKALALEWARYNIQVNAICPGYIITPMNATELSQEKIYKHITGKIPMNRLGEVNELAGAAVFLASDAANYMTGQTMTIDGGWTAQ
jgi:NAD(P)-dependent dehydrogenase (short-subunit alcohol dehydrogenase family)